MNQTKGKKIDLQILVRVAILIAMNVLLMNYLGLHTQYFKIGFAFVPIALCGMLYGAKWARSVHHRRFDQWICGTRSRHIRR